MADNDNPNGQNQDGTANDQKDYKALYLDLSAKVANGEYVAKNVYTGLQTKHEKEVLAHKADADALAAANQKATDLDGTLKTLQGQFNEQKTTLETTTANFTTEQSKNKRLTLIMGKFPGLVEFEGQGLLPVAATDEELVTKLTKFQELHGASQQQQRKDFNAGHTDPPDPKHQQNPNAEQLLQEALAFQREGKFKEYNAKMNEYYKATAK